MLHLTLADALTPDAWTETAARMALALALGAACGWDRERGGKAAGLRTYMMVSLGAALFTIVGLELIDSLRGEDDSVRYDPSRIVAGIVTGIGFLGAGTIMQSGKNIQGLTTAAGLWVIAGVGIACGAGMYTLAGMAAAGVLLVLIVMRWIEHRLGRGQDG